MATDSRFEKTPLIVDETFLQEVLRERECDPTLTVTSLKSTDDSARNGYLSNLVRFEVNIASEKERKENTIYLVMKKLPDDEISQNHIAGSSAYPVEMKMFRNVIPKIHEILRDAGIKTELAAKFYYCKDTMPFTLILEDLSVKGFKMASKQKGLDLDHCVLVMKYLARMHAATIILHGREKEYVESFNENHFTERHTDNFFQRVFKKTLRALASVVDVVILNNDNYADRLLKRIETLRKDHKDSYAPVEGGLNTLVHGDMWINNLLFKYGSSGEVVDVKFVDFQLSCYCSVVVDLVYFLITSPTEAVRISHTETLLRVYHVELCDLLPRLGYTRPLLTFDELLKEYESKYVFGFITFAVVLPIVVGVPDDTIEGDVASEPEDEDNIDDFVKRISTPKYVEVMKRLLPEFASKGAF